MFRIYLVAIALALGVTACNTTPDTWHPSDHFEAMRHCKFMCGAKRIKSYIPYTGECNCFYKTIKKSRKK